MSVNKPILLYFTIIFLMIFGAYSYYNYLSSPLTSDKEFIIGKHKYRLIMLSKSQYGEQWRNLGIYLSDAENYTCQELCYFLGKFFTNYSLDSNGYYNLSKVDSVLSNYYNYNYSVTIVGSNVRKLYEGNKVEYMSIKNGNAECKYKYKDERCRISWLSN